MVYTTQRKHYIYISHNIDKNIIFGKIKTRRTGEGGQEDNIENTIFEFSFEYQIIKVHKNIWNSEQKAKTGSTRV